MNTRNLISRFWYGTTPDEKRAMVLVVGLFVFGLLMRMLHARSANL